MSLILNPNGLEKRRFERYPCSPEERESFSFEGLACHCYLLRGSDLCRVEEPPSLLARIVNISKGGAGLHVGVRFEMDEVVFVVFRCGSRSFKLEARVLRSDEQHNGTYMIGLGFQHDLGDEPLEIIRS